MSLWGVPDAQQDAAAVRLLEQVCVWREGVTEGGMLSLQPALKHMHARAHSHTHMHARARPLQPLNTQEQRKPHKDVSEFAQ